MQQSMRVHLYLILSVDSLGFMFQSFPILTFSMCLVHCYAASQRNGGFLCRDKRKNRSTILFLRT